MSVKHPIVAVTGSSGAGSPTVTAAIKAVLRRLGSSYCIIDGEGFHRYERLELQELAAKYRADGHPISHFAPEANLLDMLESLLREYGDKGRGMHRRYVHDARDAEETGCPEGTFTAWQAIPENTDILVYEGLHGCFVSDSVNIAKYMDLKIGVVPIVNLEWMQKIHRDTRHRGYSLEEVMATVERRLPDYVRHITPQFSRTDINFQRIPVSDTSNPFEPQEVPSVTESMIVVRFRSPKKLPYSLPYLLQLISGSRMTRHNSLIMPGAELQTGIQVILEPIMAQLLEQRDAVLAADPVPA
jgi:phosphoribulokinase